MTNPTKLEELQKKIQELVPEIMELKLGCKAVLYGDFNKIVQIVGNIPIGCFLLSDGRTHHGNIYNVDNYNTILGRDIQLADVLLALSPRNFFVDQDGHFFKAFRKEISYEYIFENGKNVQWQLTKPLHLQSPETIDFLHSILCQ